MLFKSVAKNREKIVNFGAVFSILGGGEFRGHFLWANLDSRLGPYLCEIYYYNTNPARSSLSNHQMTGLEEKIRMTDPLLRS